MQFTSITLASLHGRYRKTLSCVHRQADIMLGKQQLLGHSLAGTDGQNSLDGCRSMQTASCPTTDIMPCCPEAILIQPSQPNQFMF
jgi:hypothetical protein